MSTLLKIRLLLWVALFTIIIISCKHDSELSPGTPEVCFDSQILPVLRSSCTMSGCHDGSNDLPTLATYDDIRKLIEPGKPIQSKLHKVLTANRMLGNAMPPKPKEKLDNEHINLISIWILQGGEHTSCNVECDTTTVTFNGSILPITSSYCKGCHSGGNPEGGILLTDYNSIKSAVESGRFVGAVEQLQGFTSMPPKGRLSDCNLAQIKIWIKNGMPNN